MNPLLFMIISLFVNECPHGTPPFRAPDHRSQPVRWLASTPDGIEITAVSMMFFNGAGLTAADQGQPQPAMYRPARAVDSPASALDQTLQPLEQVGSEARGLLRIPG